VRSYTGREIRLEQTYNQWLQLHVL